MLFNKLLPSGHGLRCHRLQMSLSAVVFGAKHRFLITISKSKLVEFDLCNDVIRIKAALNIRKA